MRVQKEDQAGRGPGSLHLPGYALGQHLGQTREEIQLGVHALDLLLGRLIQIPFQATDLDLLWRNEEPEERTNRPDGRNACRQCLAKPAEDFRGPIGEEIPEPRLGQLPALEKVVGVGETEDRHQGKRRPLRPASEKLPVDHGQSRPGFLRTAVAGGLHVKEETSLRDGLPDLRPRDLPQEIAVRRLAHLSPRVPFHPEAAAFPQVVKEKRLAVTALAVEEDDASGRPSGGPVAVVQVGEKEAD